MATVEAPIELQPMTGTEKPGPTINIEAQNELAQRASNVIAKIKTITITDDEQYEYAGEVLKTAQLLKKDMLAFTKPHKDYWNKGKAAVMDVEHALVDPLDKVLDTFGRSMGKYQADLEQQRKIEREMVLAQQKAEMDASALEIAQGLEESGDSAGAQAVIEQAAKMQPEVNVESFAPHVRGTAKRTTWLFEIVDPELVPDKYWVINEQMIQAEVNACKENTNIPGVRVTSETKVSARV